MKVLLDTSVIVDIDRGVAGVIDVCRRLVSEHDARLSTVTVSEILTGSYLRGDYAKAVAKAKRVLGQFTWVSLDGPVAEQLAQLNAYLLTEGQPIEYPDNAIAATCLVTACDFLLTRDKEHFTRIPALRGRVVTPEEIRGRL